MAQFDDLTHRRSRPGRCGDVGENLARHLHRHQGITEYVGVGGEREILKPFADAEKFTEFGALAIAFPSRAVQPGS